MLIEIHPWIADLLEANLENAEFLVPQWLEARASSAYTLGEALAVRERWLANIDALVLAGDEAEDLLTEALASDEPALVAAAAQAKLQTASVDDLETVWQRFLDGPPEMTASVALGLVHHAPPTMRARLQQFDDPSTPEWLFATATLQSRLEAVYHAAPANSLLEADDPVVRATAWRVLGGLDAAPDLDTLVQGDFERGFVDPVDAVAEAAWWAAARRRQPWLQDYAFVHADADVRALRWLCILSAKANLDRIIEILSRPDPDPAQVLAAGASGAPAVAQAILPLLDHADVELAAVAAHTFERITGARFEHDMRVELPVAEGEDPDLAESVYLPDGEQTRAWWGRESGRLLAFERCWRGLDEATTPAPDLDCEALQLQRIRDHVEGRTPDATSDPIGDDRLLIAAWSQEA